MGPASTDSGDMPAPRPVAFVLLAGLASLFAWWIWQQGAFFGGVFYPGAIGAGALLALLFVFAPFRARLRGPAAASLMALSALAAWTVLSGSWGSIAAAGPEDGARVFLYAGVFFLGAWLALALPRPSMSVLLPVGLAGGAVGVATTVVLAKGQDVLWYLHPDATLRFPIGYRNANAALLLICMWPLLAIAASRAGHWALRAGAVGATTVLAELAILAQSRASMFAAAIGLAVLIAFAPRRLRLVPVAALVAIPTAIAFPTLIEVFRHGAGDRAALPLLRDSAHAIWATSALATIAAAIAFFAVEPRLRLSRVAVRRISWSVGVTAAAIVIAGGALLIEREGSPFEFIDERVSQILAPESSPDFLDQGVRYGANVQSNRGDFWRVSIGSGSSRPLVGNGAGAFAPEYLRERRSHETPRDPHSVEMLMFAELGLVGLGLFVVFVVSGLWAVLRSRSSGLKAAWVAAAGLAAFSQWLAQVSVDWFWQYPGVTAPAIFLLGAAAAPQLFARAAGERSRWRLAAGAVAAVVAIAMVPLFVADRYSNRAAGAAENDPQLALADYGRAADLYPLDATPLVERASLAASLGDRRLAYESVNLALEREPTRYGAQFLLVELLAGDGHPRARQELRQARELNPSDPELSRLAQMVRAGERRGGDRRNRDNGAP